MTGRWRDKLERLRSRSRSGFEMREGTRGQSDTVEFETEHGTASLTSALSEMETTALDVYAAHGLPTLSGEYAWTPGSKDWRFLGARLSPQERWHLVQSDAAGQRYGTLSDLGRNSATDEVVRMAGEVLGAIAELRRETHGPETGVPVLTALKLGADWQALRQRGTWLTTSDLKLSVPDTGSPSPD